MRSYSSISTRQHLSFDRCAGIAAAVLIHGVVICALLQALGSVTFPVPPPPTSVRFFEPDKVTPPPPVPLLPPIVQIVVRPIIDHLLPPPVLPPDTITTTPDLPPPPVQRTVAAPVRLPPRVDPSFPLVHPDYPAVSVRLGEEGITVLSCLIGGDGRVIEARIKKSSGSTRLDEAAVKGALAGFKLRPGTEDGRPVESWIDLPVRWKLVD